MPRSGASPHSPRPGGGGRVWAGGVKPRIVTLSCILAAAAPTHPRPGEAEAEAEAEGLPGNGRGGIALFLDK